MYRFYHQSFKVYSIQHLTEQIATTLKGLLPDHLLDGWFMTIVEEGTGRTFERSYNKDWPVHTRPMLEAYWHARYMLGMVVGYGEHSRRRSRGLPSGWAAVLCLTVFAKHSHPVRDRTTSGAAPGSAFVSPGRVSASKGPAAARAVWYHFGTRGLSPKCGRSGPEMPMFRKPKSGHPNACRRCYQEPPRTGTPVRHLRSWCSRAFRGGRPTRPTTLGPS